MVTAVIFDMDGLLIDSEVFWGRARREYALSRGCDWTAHDELAAKGMNSMEWAALIEERCDFGGGREAIIEGVSTRMVALYEETLPLLPGATRVVPALAASYPLGLASSSPPRLIEHVLSEAGLRQCFRVVVSSDEVGKGKPSPDVFLVTGERIGVPPDQIVVFEDSSSGIRAAHAAGMHVVAVPNPHYPPDPDALSLASLVLSSLDELRPTMLESMGEGSALPRHAEPS